MGTIGPNTETLILVTVGSAKVGHEDAWPKSVRAVPFNEGGVPAKFLCWHRRIEEVALRIHHTMPRGTGDSVFQATVNAWAPAPGSSCFVASFRRERGRG